MATFRASITALLYSTLLLLCGLPTTASAADDECFFNTTFAQQARWQDDQLYQAAAKDYVTFWEKCAEDLVWWEKWQQPLLWSPPYAQWFVGGKLNVSYNCLDRHIEAEQGHKVAFIHITENGTQRKITYQELYQEVNQLAHVMRQLGVAKGDRVAIYLPMIPEAVAAMLACTRIGAVHTVIFGGIGAQSVKERLQDAQVKLLVTADGSYRSGKKITYKAAIDTSLAACPDLENVLVVRNNGIPVTLQPGRDLWYHELLQEAPPYCAPEPMDAEDPLFILYTSGTTGKPKGILHTTGGYLVGVYSTFKWVFDIQPTDLYWCTADIGWITGHSYIVYGPLANGASQILYEGGFDYPAKNQFTKIIDEHQVSIVYTAPTLVRMFMQWGEKCLQGAQLNSLRLLGTVGEPINPEAWSWFYEHIGHRNCPIVDTWFQTEMGAIAVAPLPGVTPLKPGSVTKALPGYKVAVLDESGQPSAKGLLAVLQPYPAMMRGIYGDPARYVATYWSKWEGRYYLAGDFATCDEDGYIWVGGRSDEVLKVAGHRIGTAEVENALIEHPAVAESAVIGVRDDLKGQKIVGFVVLKDQADRPAQLEDALKHTVAQVIGSYARPHTIVIVKRLPKTHSGKILRRLLKNLVEGQPIGNVATLSDSTVIEELRVVCEALHSAFYPTAD